MTYPEADDRTFDSAAIDDVVDTTEGPSDCTVELEEGVVDVAGANMRQIHCMLREFFVSLTTRRRNSRRLVHTRTSRR